LVVGVIDVDDDIVIDGGAAFVARAWFSEALRQAYLGWNITRSTTLSYGRWPAPNPPPPKSPAIVPRTCILLPLLAYHENVPTISTCTACLLPDAHDQALSTPAAPSAVARTLALVPVAPLGGCRAERWGGEVGGGRVLLVGAEGLVGGKVQGVVLLETGGEQVGVVL